MSPPSRREVRADLLALSLSAAVLYLLFLGARDLWNPNEPTYGQAVVEMASRGDWIVPTVNGNVFAEKPILYYWLALVSAGAFGRVDEFALRVPCALAGVLGVLLVYLLVLPYAGRTRSRLAAALFGSTYMVFWTSRIVQMDLLVTVAVLATVLAATRATDLGRPPGMAWSLAGLAAGLGFLAKGPVAWVLPALVLLAYLAWDRRLGSLRTPALVAGAAVCVAVAATWPLLLLARGEAGALGEVLFRQNVTRFVRPWDHQASWWYYLPYFWIDMAPWAWLVPIAAALPERSTGERRLDRLAWAWIAVVLVFFSLSQSKRSPYILPLAPAVAILASGVAERFLDGRLRGARAKLALAFHAVFAAVALASGFAALRLVPSRYPDIAVEAKMLAWLLIAGGVAIAAALFGRSRARVAAPAALFSLLLCVYGLASAKALPAADAYKSPRAFCARMAAVVPPGAPVASFRFWRFKGGYAFYSGRPIRNLVTEDEARSFWRGEGAFLIVEGDELGEAREILGDLGAPLVESGVGSARAYLFSSGAGGGPGGGASAGASKE